jgi:hypothetical protein
MDTTEFAEGLYWTPKLVEASPVKVGVVITDAKPEDSKYGAQLVCDVSINKKIKRWAMNRDSVANMHKIGVDSKSWIGKRVHFQVLTVNGKQRIIGLPVMPKAALVVEEPEEPIEDETEFQ